MTADLEKLRAELDEFAQPNRNIQRSPREERIIAGFKEIQRFVEQHGSAPAHGEDRDIFERLYAVRLERLRQLDECRELLAPLDHQALLEIRLVSETDSADAISDDELLAELEGRVAESSDLTNLRHVRPRSEVRAVVDEIADRKPCKDFDAFKPLLDQAGRELKAGVRKTIRFGKDVAINEGEFFIVGGQLAYVARIGEILKITGHQKDARLRVIYANGTESNLLLRSLQRALYKDEAGRRLSDPDAGPLFGDSLDKDDVESGTIYVLRSQSDHPYVAEHRELIHKIGVTGGKVETRIANAAHDATYLLADVEVVATYKLAGINRVKLENLLHRVFAPARLNLTIEDRFGKPVQPQEWFLVPLHVLDEAVSRVRDGSITDVVYNPATASLEHVMHLTN